MSKKKPTYLQNKGKDVINKKALIWTGLVLAGIIIIMAVMLILNK